jgi:hypothetical protein
MSMQKIAFICAMVLMCCLCAKSDTNSAEHTEETQYIPLDTLSKYFRLSEVKGWQEFPDGFHSFDTTRLYDLIDGGAVIYNSNGMQHGIYHRMKQRDGRMYEALVMDFASPKNASAMYLEQKKQTGASIRLGDYDSTEIGAGDVLSGICAYGHFSVLYFELTLTGYTEQAEAEKEAVDFI